MRVSAPAGSQSSSSLASPKCRRMLSSAFSSIATSALAMPLRKPSVPMKPLCGLACACAIRCSPPPKPISSRRSSIGVWKQRAQIGRRRLGEIEREPRQQRVEQRGLPRLERMPFAPAEEGALRGVVAVVTLVHAVIVAWRAR